MSTRRGKLAINFMITHWKASSGNKTTTPASAFSVSSLIAVSKSKPSFIHSGRRNYSVFDRFRDTVPYSKRTRFVLPTMKFERKIGEYIFKHLFKEYFKILPPTHPQSFRVRWILKDIVEALYKGVNKDGDVNVTSKHLDGLIWEILVLDQPQLCAFCIPGGKICVTKGWIQYFSTDAEIAMVIGHEVGHEVARHFAERLTNKLWFPVIKFIGFLPYKMFSYFVPMRGVVNKISQLLQELPLYPHRYETEADYIGLMLMASAGYHPQFAITLYEKLERLSQKQSLPSHPSGERKATFLAQVREVHQKLRRIADDLLSQTGPFPTSAQIGDQVMAMLRVYFPTHPSGETNARLLALIMASKRGPFPSHPSGAKRAQMLAQVMEEALTIHEEVNAGHWVQQRRVGGLSLIPKV